MLVDCESGETVYSRRTEGVCSICLFVDPPEQSFDYCFITIQESVVYMNSVNFDLSLMNFAVSTLRISPTNCPYRKPLDALACDGKLFLSSMTGDLCVFDLLSRSFIGCFTVTNEAVRLLSLIDDTSISVTTASAKIMLVDLKENFRIISTLAENMTVTSMEYSRLRQSVFVQTPDGLIVSVPLDGQEVKIHSHFASAKVTSFACRMDGTIAFASTKGVSLWNLSELKHTKSVHVPKASVSCLAVGSDCRILCGFESGALRVYTIDLELEYEIIACHRGSVSGSAGCSDYVATGGSDGIIRIWKYVSNIMEFTQFASSRIGGIEVCNGTDNRILGVWNEKREIVYIDLKSKKIARKFTTNKLGNITGMAQMLFRKMDWVLVTSHIAGYVAVWDIDYPEPIACVNVRKLPLTSLAVVEESVLCGTAQGELVQVTNLSQDTTEIKVKSNPLTPDPIIKVCVWASTVLLLNAQGLIMTTKL